MGDCATLETAFSHYVLAWQALLQESRQGYCTYFATAFVLLARAEGIPVRYVQGYCVPIPENGAAYVDSSMAHAWPEAYLEGVGWISFEPTPGDEDRRSSLWGPVQPDSGNAGQAQADFAASDEEPGREAESAGNTPMPEDGVEGDNEAEGDRETLFYFRKLLNVGIPMLLIACTVVLAADYAVNRYRYKRMEPCERLRIEVVRNLKILSRFGVEKEESETLQELRERAERLSVAAGKEADEALTEAESAENFRFIEAYEKVVYGGAEAGEDMLADAVQAGERLLVMLKQ